MTAASVNVLKAYDAPVGPPTHYRVFACHRGLTPDRFATLAGAAMCAVRQDVNCNVLAAWRGCAWVRCVAGTVDERLVIVCPDLTAWVTLVGETGELP